MRNNLIIVTFQKKILKELVTDLQKIELHSIEKEAENDAFKIFISKTDGAYVDNLVSKLDDEISPKIDCTKCGRCCQVLMIHVTEKEVEKLAENNHLSVEKIKENYVETSQQGQMILNKMPCSFLNGKKCSIYGERFTECREFPHLHKPNFIGRIFSTMMYYSMCPIIFNVVEALKEKTNFK